MKNMLKKIVIEFLRLKNRFFYMFIDKKNPHVSFVAEEFFHEDLRGFGGYGMTVKRITDYYNLQRNDMTWDVCLTSHLPIAINPCVKKFHSSDVLFRAENEITPNKNLIEYTKLLGKLNPLFFITIDYYPTYNYPFFAAPHVPVVIYIRDPRGKEEWDRFSEIPLEMKQRDRDSVDHLKKLTDEKINGMKELIAQSQKVGRKIIFASNGNFLIDRAERTFGISPIQAYRLMNPVELPELKEINYSKRPSLCFIGRFDAQKRFWISFEMAKRFKDVDFYICGETNTPELVDPMVAPYRELPNMHFLGVTKGEKKAEVLNNCWGLINSSVHEGYPVTFQEMFAYGKTVVSCLDPDGLVSRYGYYSGEIFGEGMDSESLDRFAKSIEEFLSNDKMRIEKGKAAREYMEKTHTFESFNNQLNHILKTENIIA